MFVFKISIFFMCIVFYSNEISWSNWTSCTQSENCYQKSELECDKGKGIQCVPFDRTNYLYQTNLSDECDEVCNGHSSENWTKTRVKKLHFRIFNNYFLLQKHHGKHINNIVCSMFYRRMGMCLLLVTYTSK